MSFLLSAIILLFLNLQNAAEPVAATETLAEVPEHVLRGLPEEVRLFPSAVDKTRIGECWGQGRRGQGEWAVARLPLGASEVGSSLQKQHIYTLTCFEEFVFQLRIQGGQEHLTPTHPPLRLSLSSPFLRVSPRVLLPAECIVLPLISCDLRVMIVFYLFHYFVFVFISITCIDRECLHFLFIFMPPVTDALHGPHWVFEWIMSVSQCFLLEFLVEYSQAFLYWVLFLCSNL